MKVVAAVALLLLGCMAAAQAQPSTGEGQGGAGSEPSYYGNGIRIPRGMGAATAQGDVVAAAAAAAATPGPPQYLWYRYCIANRVAGPAWVTLSFNGTLRDDQVLVGASCAIRSFSSRTCDCFASNCGTGPGKNGVACCDSTTSVNNQWWAMDASTEDTDQQGRQMWRCRWQKMKGNSNTAGVSEMFVAYYVATLSYS